MNKKQLIVVLGLAAYAAGGMVVVVPNLETFIWVLRFKPNLLMPIIETYGIILISGVAMFWFLSDRKK